MTTMMVMARSAVPSRAFLRTRWDRKSFGSIASGAATCTSSNATSTNGSTSNGHRLSHRYPVQQMTICAQAASGPSSPSAAMYLAVGTSVQRGGNRFLSAASKIAAASVQSFEGPWYEKYLLLEQYKKEHGNCLVPNLFVYDEIKLGKWVHKQRNLYKKGKLSANQREMLDELGFSWDPIGDTWERNFAMLEQYRDREGHCNVPKSYEEEDIKLGRWLGWQRQAFKKGKLNESYQHRLEAIGISWDPLADDWEQNFVLLEHFSEREGHCNVLATHEENSVKLGPWLQRQRRAFKKGKLNESYQHRLEAIGVSWDPLADGWEQNFALLEHFSEREGHCNVHVRYNENGVQLGSWLDSQRQAFKRGKLNESHQHRLEAIGMCWDPYGDSWEQNFALLECYNEREGHCNVRRGHEENGVQLGSWLERQRHAFRRGKLDESRQRRLEKLGVVWEPYADRWERNCALLQQYKDREGHCNVPVSHIEGESRLGNWVGSLRYAFKRGKLDESYQRRLENLGMVWDPLTDQWERNFALLQQYQRREGHCKVPHTHKEGDIKLGIWVETQRQARKGNKSSALSEDRIKRLDEICFCWSI